MPEQSPVRLTETAGTITPAVDGSAGRYRVLCINAGRGSSGTYPASTLREAAAKGLVGSGTPAYFDHPGATEAMDRPERSVRDIAGVFTSPAVWDEAEQGLVADLQVFAPYRELVAEMAPHIGLSIRGSGVMEAAGDGSRTVTSLDAIESVDLVTKAGRGGKFLSLLESARANVAEARNVGQHLESRLHQDFTNRADDMAANGQLTRDERIHLSGAVGKGLSAFADHLQENAPQLYQRDLWDEPNQPAAPAVSEGAPAPTTTTPVKEGLVPELTDADVAQLRESAARAEAAEARLAESNARIAALQARDTARPLVAAQLAEASAPLPAPAQARVVEAVLAAGVPTNDAGVDTAALTAAVEAAATREAAYVAALAAPAPVTEAWGSFAAAAKPEPVAEAAALADLDADLARIFNRTVKG